MKNIAVLLVLSILISCEDDLLEAEALGKNADIVGTWIENGSKQDIRLFKRAGNLNDTSYGFIIRKGGVFIERKNSDWCATPPISYDNFEGTWEAISDSLIEITVGYWGGTMTYQMRIISLDEDNLSIRYLYANDREESRYLPN